MANTKITSKVIADANILTAAIADNAVTGDKVADDVALAGNPTTTTQTAGNSTTRIATTAFVSTAISNLVDSSPAALNTLNELAAALGDDANFSTTVTNSIATKLPLAGGTMTGTLILAGDDNDVLIETKNTSASSASQFKISHNLGSDVIQSQRGDLTLDVSGDIFLDAGSGNIKLKGAGTEFGSLENSSSDLQIKASIQDKDIKFAGNDGGSTITALTLDMSEAGLATFNDGVKADYFKATGSIPSETSASTAYLDFASGNARIVTKGADGSTQGGFQILQQASDSSPANTPLFIDSSGNIGFNTTNLSINDSSGGTTGNSTATPNRFMFNNNYSNGQTDASLKLYLFNENATRQGFTSGPNYDLQYHSSGHDTGMHTFYVANTEIMRVKKTTVGIGSGGNGHDSLLHLEDSSHTAITIQAGTNSSASLRLKNDAQDWDVNTQTNDNFAVYNQTSGTQPFTITPSGYVQTNLNPAFRARAKSAEVYASGWQKVLYDGSVTQRGSAYASSRFTAPVDGWYQFNAQWNADNNSDNDGTLSLWINGSNSDLAGSVSMSNTGANYDGHVVSGCCYLAATHYVEVYRYASVSTTTRSADPYGGWFSGFLIG